jgi:hypothetical protein
MYLFFLPIFALWLIFTGSPIWLIRARPINTRPAVLEGGWFRILGVVLLIEFFLEIFDAPVIVRLIGVIAAFMILIAAIVISLLPPRMRKRHS